MSKSVTDTDISQQAEVAHQPLTHIPLHVLKIIQQFAKETKKLLQEHLIAEYLFGSGMKISSIYPKFHVKLIL